MGGTRPTGRPADRWQKTGRRRTRPVLLAVPDLRLVSVQGSIGLAIAWDRVNDGVRTVAGGDPNVQPASPPYACAVAPYPFVRPCCCAVLNLGFWSF